MKLIVLSGIFLILVSFTVTDTITGTWQTTLSGNVNAIMRYKKDSTFEVFINKKVFTSGKYTYSGDTLTFTEDNGCRSKSGSYIKGVYIVNFFTADSIQFEAVNDTCVRKRDLNYLKMGKIEKGISQ